MANKYIKSLIIIVVFLTSPALKAEKPQKLTPKFNPTDSVYSVAIPAYDQPTTKIWTWAYALQSGNYFLYRDNLIRLTLPYKHYLLFVPNDSALQNYIDPIAYGQTGTQAVLKFWYNSTTSAVNATVYRYNKTTNIKGDSVDVITDVSFLKSRLWDILRQHIVESDTEETTGLYNANGNGLLHYSSGIAVKGSIKNDSSKIMTTVTTANGKVCFIDKPIGSTLASTFKVLMSKPEFSAFDSLLTGIPDTCVQQIFAQQGIDKRIKMFNNYRYTVYVPSNQAIGNAIKSGKFLAWDSIASIKNTQTRNAEIQKLLCILRYHFQEGMVYAGRDQNQKMNTFLLKNSDSSTRWNTIKNKPYKLGVEVSGSAITLTTENNSVAHVITTSETYNLLAQDYIFSNLPSYYKNADGTGSGSNFSSSTIISSSTVAIHLIDDVLTFE